MKKKVVLFISILVIAIVSIVGYKTYNNYILHSVDICNYDINCYRVGNYLFWNTKSYNDEDYSIKVNDELYQHRHWYKFGTDGLANYKIKIINKFGDDCYRSDFKVMPEEEAREQEAYYISHFSEQFHDITSRLRGHDISPLYLDVDLESKNITLFLRHASGTYGILIYHLDKVYTEDNYISYFRKENLENIKYDLLPDRNFTSYSELFISDIFCGITTNVELYGSAKQLKLLGYEVTPYFESYCYMDNSARFNEYFDGKNCVRYGLLQFYHCKKDNDEQMLIQFYTIDIENKYSFAERRKILLKPAQNEYLQPYRVFDLNHPKYISTYLTEQKYTYIPGPF